MGWPWNVREHRPPWREQKEQVTTEGAQSISHGKHDGFDECVGGAETHSRADSLVEACCSREHRGPRQSIEEVARRPRRGHFTHRGHAPTPPSPDDNE